MDRSSGVVIAALAAVIVVTVLAGLRSGARGASGGPARWGAILPGLVALVLFTWLAQIEIARSARPAPAIAPDALEVEITARAWWWQVRYRPGPEVANELVVPVGRQIVLHLTSSDVIHALWVPGALDGRVELIPGRTRQVALELDRPGVHRGECAAICSLPHARMALRLEAVEPAAFERWIDAQRAPARAPSDAREQRGLEVFLARGCAGCHTIDGTAARGEGGPRLTHLASRETLAAGAAPNTPDALARWLAAPRSLVAGGHGALPAVDGDDRDGLVAYLGSLR